MALFPTHHTKLYVQIRSVELGTYAATDKAELVLCVGTKHHIHDYPYKFKSGNKHDVNHTWTFNIVHPQTGEFYVVLYKHHLLGDKEIGQLGFCVGGFTKNTVVSKKFMLQSANVNAMPATVEMDIHICADGSHAFYAPQGEISDSAIIQTSRHFGEPENKIAQ